MSSSEAGRPSIRNEKPHMVGKRTSRSSTSVLEAVILLVFLMVSIAVCVELFGVSSAQSSDARKLSAASSLASDVAERFAADPEGVPAVIDGRDPIAEGGSGLTAHSTVRSVPTDAGILYTIDISVLDGASDEVFSLSSSKYVSR